MPESVRPEPDELNRTTSEVRVCPLGPPKLDGLVAYAWCSLCERVRKNRDHCPLVAPEDR